MLRAERTKAATKNSRRVRATTRNPRHARLVLAGAVAVSAAIVAAWFPVGALLTQRTTLKDDQSQLTALRGQDAALSQEKKNLSDSAEIDRIARQQYQLVTPGQSAYEVLPPPGSTTGGSTSDGASSGPVAPSAAAELPPGGVTTTTTRTPHSAASGSSSFVSRMLRALEFWR